MTASLTLRGRRLSVAALLVLGLTACSTSDPVAERAKSEQLQKAVTLLNKRDARKACELLLGRGLTRARWNLLGEQLNEQLHKTDQAQALACRKNLSSLAQAIELYQADSEGGRHLPDRLSALQSLPSFQTLPQCPAAGSDTYSAGYRPDHQHGTYRLSCSGAHHRNAGLRPNHPSLDSRWGLAPLEEVDLAWWPDHYRVDVVESKVERGAANLILRESYAWPRGEEQVGELRLRMCLVKGSSGEKAWQLGSRDIRETPKGTSLLGRTLRAEVEGSVPTAPPASATRDDCARILGETATALEAWSCEHQGHYPPTLKSLVPKYLRSLPVCPKAPLVLSPTYVTEASGTHFTVRCRGQHADLVVTDSSSLLTEAATSSGAPGATETKAGN